MSRLSRRCPLALYGIACCLLIAFQARDGSVRSMCAFVSVPMIRFVRYGSVRINRDAAFQIVRAYGSSDSGEYSDMIVMSRLRLDSLTAATLPWTMLHSCA